MSDEDEGTGEVERVIDEMNERGQRVREAVSRLRSTSPYALHIPHRAERGATGEMFITIGDDERRIFGDPVYADEDGTLTTVNPNPPSVGVPNVDDEGLGNSRIESWRSGWRLGYAELPTIPSVRMTIGAPTREESARLARHFYRQRDAALKRVAELEAALDEAHKRMIRFRMRTDGGEA